MPFVKLHGVIQDILNGRLVSNGQVHTILLQMCFYRNILMVVGVCIHLYPIQLTRRKIFL